MNKLLAVVSDGGGGGDSGGSITNPFLKGSPLENLSGTGFLQKILPNALGLLLVAGVTFFLFMILIGSVTWITSGGDKAAIEASKSRITNAIIGVVILLSTFAIVNIVENFFGINILSIDIGPLVIQ